MNFRKWLREPLVHFLLAGLALFLGASLLEPSRVDDRHIRVGRDELLNYLQGRAQLYDADSFDLLLREMPPEERREMAREAALNEALYREGTALDLTSADPLVRQRVIQQMRLLLMEEAAADVQVSDADVAEYYRTHAADYGEPALVSFTHVYFPGAGSKAQAEAALQQLRRENVGFGDAGRFGERFLYQRNYSNSGPPEIASQFGKEFAGQVFALEPGSWQGPIRSDHGWHLVLVTRREDARLPPLEDMAGRVREDALAARRQELARGAMDRLLADYDVDYADGVAK